MRRKEWNAALERFIEAATDVMEAAAGAEELNEFGDVCLGFSASIAQAAARSEPVTNQDVAKHEWLRECAEYWELKRILADEVDAEDAKQAEQELGVAITSNGGDA